MKKGKRDRWELGERREKRGRGREKNDGNKTRQEMQQQNIRYWH